MKKLIYLLPVLTVFLFSSCSSDDDENNDNPEAVYNIVNNGNGGVTSINDANDSEPLEVVQAVPSVQNSDYPKSMPIVLFFNDKIYLNSLETGFEVMQNGQKIGGTVSINEGANGFAILTFSPSEIFASNATIELSLIGVKDDGGNEIDGGIYQLVYQTNNQNTGSFDGNGDFSSSEGVLFIGDGAIMNGNQGCVSPVTGSGFAAITTGDALISSGSAIGGASSMMILGAIEESFTSVSFSYNFLSTEFNEFVDSEFDDSVIVTVIGSEGAYSEFITSVNTVGIDGNTQCEGFPGIPDTGDDYAGATGWINKTINTGNIGTPAYVIFLVTDVADTIYSSVLAIDNVSY